MEVAGHTAAEAEVRVVVGRTQAVAQEAVVKSWVEERLVGVGASRLQREESVARRVGVGD